MKRTAITMIGILLLFTGTAGADRMTASFPDPSRPGMVKVMNGTGSITVTAYNGSEVIVDTGDVEFQTPPEDDERMHGLRQIGGTGMNLTTNGDENAIEVARSWNNDVTLNIQVPVNTSISIGGSVTSGDITVTGVTGQIEVRTLDGDITLDRISGSVVANTLDGEILAVFDRVDADKPLSFTTLDGDVDVMLPADIKASVKLSTMDGTIGTDFDIQQDTTGEAREAERNLQAQQEAIKASQDARRQTSGVAISNNGVKIKVPMPMTNLNIGFPGIPQSAFYGIINGGGQYIQLSTMDGNIYFRKAE